MVHPAAFHRVRDFVYRSMDPAKNLLPYVSSSTLCCQRSARNRRRWFIGPKDAAFAFQQPIEAYAAPLAEPRYFLMVEPQHGLDFLIGKIPGSGHVPDALSHGRFELAPLSNALCTLQSARWVRSKKCQIVGNGAFDPFGFHPNVTMLAALKFCLLPVDRRDTARGS
jgi:hypothetical protein